MPSTVCRICSLPAKKIFDYYSTKAFSGIFQCSH